MTGFRNLVGLGLASAAIMMTAPVFALTPAGTPAKPAASPTSKPVVGTKAPTTAAPTHLASARRGTHMAKTTLGNGKKVTYDCRLAGNKNKQACKG